MTTRRPLIGISASFMHADPKRALFKGKTLLFAEQSLLHWVMSAGAVPVLLPTVGGQLFAADMVDQIDGLVLQGGADVAPSSYGEEPLRPEWHGDAIRDAYEMELVHLCMSRGKPILGVCRGTQVLNVALGGSLYQDIETLHEHKRVHRNWEVYDQHAHEVAVEPQSWLGGWYGATPEHFTYKVNSVHHQGIKALGKGLVVEARSLPDGIVEAIRYEPIGAPAQSWVYGVQWHPEFMQQPSPDRDPEMMDPRPLLQGFLAAVDAHRGA
jgi:putative glutamine amidotransferase